MSEPVSAAFDVIVSPLRALTQTNDTGPVLIAERSWTRAQAILRIDQLRAEWERLPQLRDAKLVALETPPRGESVLRLWALIELGIPFVPLHPAWSAVQRRNVLEETRAALLPSGPEDASSPLDASPSTGAADLGRTATPDTPLAVVFTSGSSGLPKGAVLSHRAFWSSAMASRAALGWTNQEVFYLSLPLAHIGGLSIVTRSAVFGGCVVLPAAGYGRGFDPASFVARCSETRASVVSLVPTQLHRLCGAGLPAPRDVKCVLLGGAHAPVALVEAGLRLGWPIHRTYGLTEACSQVATDRRPQSSGPISLLPHSAARSGPDGRLALTGDSLFSGYFGHPPRGRDDWFLTADIVELSDGGIVPLGRADELVISGGENIHPDEVDAALASAPGVAAGCSFGRTSAEWGHELCAALIVRPDFDDQLLLGHLRAVLPSFKIPKAWVIVSDLPVTASGKISRRLCQELLAARCHPFPPRTAP